MLSSSPKLHKWLSNNGKDDPRDDATPAELLRDARMLLVPATGPPRIVTLNVLPSISIEDLGDYDDIMELLEGGDYTLQTQAMHLMCSEIGCERYRSMFRRIGYPGIIDSSRSTLLDLEEDDEDDDAMAYNRRAPHLGALFLGADNGLSAGKSLFHSLPPNRRFGCGIRGPVVIYVARWLAPMGVEHEAIFNMPLKGIELHVDDIIDCVRDSILHRYHAAGLCEREPAYSSEDKEEEARECKRQRQRQRTMQCDM